MELDTKIDTGLVDTHCHLDMKHFDNTREDVIQRAHDALVTHLITIGIDRQSSRKALTIAESHKSVHCTVGLHPHSAQVMDNALIGELKEYARSPKVVAIGETGLDYYYMNSPQKMQLRAFEKQLELAQALNLPAVIHSRDAQDDTLKIIRKYSPSLKGVLHCFSGTLEMAEEALKMGLYISFAGPVTFKKNEELKQTAKMIPDNRIIVETDAPFLSPHPKRGKTNEPAHIIYTAQTLAHIRGVTLRDIARITSLNAHELFGIGQQPEAGTIAYQIRNSLYLNVTNTCTNKCSFCVRFKTSYVKGHNLALTKEPTKEELITAIGDPGTYKEIVFCGIGEPMLRLSLIKDLSQWIKNKGGVVRINTNGQANIIYHRNVLPELKGLIDAISISLDAEDEEKYTKICKPSLKGAYKAVLSFIEESKKYIPHVELSVVETEEVDVEKCRAIAQALGVEFRLRKLNVVG
jgi:TatD DNase family protein